VNDWESPTNPYKSRFTGLQGKYQSELQKWQAENTKLFDVTEQLSKLNGERDSLATQFDAFKVKHGELESAKGVLEEQYGRLRTIATEFPDLLVFEKDSLLPDGTGDELKKKLEAFRGKLKDLGQAQAVQAITGASPTAPTPQAPKSSLDLWNQAKQALAEGRIDEYHKLYDEYIKLPGEKK
jgi:SMC interacting uncharacterized protein involved in chromosome segregation